jgi:hypothetical protein
LIFRERLLLLLSQASTRYAIVILQQLVAKLASQSKFWTFVVAECRRPNNRPLESVAKITKNAKHTKVIFIVSFVRLFRLCGKKIV